MTRLRAIRHDRGALVEAAAAKVVDSRERQALLLIARETSDPWARETAIVVLADEIAADLEAGLAERIVEELTT